MSVTEIGLSIMVYAYLAYGLGKVAPEQIKNKWYTSLVIVPLGLAALILLPLIPQKYFKEIK